MWIRKLAVSIAFVSASSLFARVFEVPVSQVEVIVPDAENRNPELGPRVCLQFDLPNEVRGIEIGYARLEIRLRLQPDSRDSLVNFEAFGLMSDWNENQRWDDFSTPGGDIDSNYFSSGTIKCAIDDVISLDLTNLAQEWNSSDDANHGLILIPRNSDSNAFTRFEYSREQLRGLAILKILVPGQDAE